MCADVYAVVMNSKIQDNVGQSSLFTSWLGEVSNGLGGY